MLKIDVSELTPIEIAAIEYHRSQRPDLKQDGTVQETALMLVNESLAQMVTVYTAAELPLLTAIGRKFLGLSRAQRDRLLADLETESAKAEPPPLIESSPATISEQPK